MMIVANCSAVKRMVIDYGDLRQRIRAAREKDRRLRVGFNNLSAADQIFCRLETMP